MSNRGSDRSDRDLEASLRDWYAGFTPEDSGPAEAGVAAAIESARSRGTWRDRGPWPKIAVGLALVALLAVLVVPLALVRSLPATGSPTPSSSASAPAATAIITPQPSSTWALVAGAGIDDAGPIPGGGMWAVSGTTLMLSYDGGETWTATSVPAEEASSFSPATVVLDAQHAWAVRAGAGSHTGGQDDFVSLVAYRTADGGRSWQSTTIPGNFAGTGTYLAFADDRHGFLVSTAWGGNGLTNVYRTQDGGATWVASPGHPLDSYFSISDADTLWASSPGGGAKCGHCDEPLLQVSRDGGMSWSTVSLPGYEGQKTTGSLGLASPPVFLDPSIGYVVVHESPTDYPANGSSRIFRTADGGRTWSAVATAPHWLDDVSVADATHWYGVATTMATPSGAMVVATDDGGKSWRVIEGPAPDKGWWGTWLVDPAHGAWIVAPGVQNLPQEILYLTADGGRTWHPADFGETGRTPGT